MEATPQSAAGDETLDGVELFASLSHADRVAVARAMARVVVADGEPVVLEGDFGHALFVIESGRARVLRDGELLRELGPGEVFGEVALLTSGRRTATVVAVGELVLLSLFKRDVWQLERELPEVGERLRAAVADHVGDAG